MKHCALCKKETDTTRLCKECNSLHSLVKPYIKGRLDIKENIARHLQIAAILNSLDLNKSAWENIKKIKGVTTRKYTPSVYDQTDMPEDKPY